MFIGLCISVTLVVATAASAGWLIYWTRFAWRKKWLVTCPECSAQRDVRETFFYLPIDKAGNYTFNQTCFGGNLDWRPYDSVRGHTGVGRAWLWSKAHGWPCKRCGRDLTAKVYEAPGGAIAMQVEAREWEHRKARHRRLQCGLGDWVCWGGVVVDEYEALKAEIESKKGRV